MNPIFLKTNCWPVSTFLTVFEHETSAFVPFQLALKTTTKQVKNNTDTKLFPYIGFFDFDGVMTLL